MDWLSTLYAEQTAADEIVIFLLLGTFVTLTFAFAIYALALIALSHWRIKKRVSLGLLLFPSAARMRQYMVEYGMSTLTALLLALTVASKHQAVEQILSADINLIGQKLVNASMPLGGLEQKELVDVGEDEVSAGEIVSWLKEGTSRRVGISAESLITPLLKSGMDKNANLVVRALVEALGPSSDSIVLQRLLFIASFALLIGYALWFSRKRWKEIEENASNSQSYSDIVKSLILPAVCIPLLLISAAAIEDKERLIKSAMAVAKVSTDAVDSSLAKVIAVQTETITKSEWKVDARDLKKVYTHIDSLDIRITQISAQISEIDRVLSNTTRATKSLSNRAEKTATEITELDNQVNTAKSALERLERKFDKHLLTTADMQQSLSVNELTTKRLANRTAGLEKRFSPMEYKLIEFEKKLADLGKQLDKQQASGGLLLVRNAIGRGNYVIRRNNANGAIQGRGSIIGLHSLKAGRYTIVSLSGNQSRNVSIRSNLSQAINFVGKPPTIQ